MSKIPQLPKKLTAHCLEGVCLGRQFVIENDPTCACADNNPTEGPVELLLSYVVSMQHIGELFYDYEKLKRISQLYLPVTQSVQTFDEEERSWSYEMQHFPYKSSDENSRIRKDLVSAFSSPSEASEFDYKRDALCYDDAAFACEDSNTECKVNTILHENENIKRCKSQKLGDEFSNSRYSEGDVENLLPGNTIDKPIKREVDPKEEGTCTYLAD